MRSAWQTKAVMAALAAAVLVAPTLRAADTQPTTAPATTKKYGTLEAWGVGQSKAALDQLEKDGDFHAANEATVKILETLAAYGSDKHAAAFREAAYAWRMTAILADVPDNVELLKFLRKNPKFAHTLAFLVNAADDNNGIAKIIRKLREKHEKDLETYSALAAAICVVHDVPMTRRINEVRMNAPDPVAIFEYFVANEKQMYFGIRNVPAELLIWVVDTTTPIKDMQWALAKYAHDDTVGKRFFDIKYDDDYFNKGTAKKISAVAYSLPNILSYGGVCADQTYFAMEVGKAIGVPTAYAGGASANGNHAWVGFLQARNKQGWWNFDTGRYAAYKGVRGMVLDPQTRDKIADNDVSLSAELIGTTDLDRETAVAFTDAAAHLLFFMVKDKPFEPEAADAKFIDARPRPLKADTDAILGLLDASLKKNLGYARSWLTIASLANEGKMTLEQKRRWSDQIMKTCGTKYPDFALGVLEPMIGTVTDTKEQDRLWQAAFILFDKRLDLAAEVRMNQAQMWKDNGDPAKALACYMDVVTRYADAGPFVIGALKGAEDMLRETDKNAKIVQLYGDTWKRIKEPKEMAAEFMMQSNWYKVGTLLARKLKDAGDTQGADAVKAKLGETLKGSG